VPNPDLEQQIQFARHNFENHQAVIRLADAKAAALITIVIFLAASGLQIAKEATHVLVFDTRAGLAFSIVFICSCVTFLLAFLWCLFRVESALKPRAGHRKPEVGRDILWQDHVLNHPNDDQYFHAVRKADSELLLRNLTDQIYELALISRKKMSAIQQARRASLWAAASWVVNMISALILLRWK
jgi:hypothetical protein